MISSSQHQENTPHPQSDDTEIHEGDNVCSLSLPAFRKQSLCNGHPTSTSRQKQAAKKKRTKQCKGLRIKPEKPALLTLQL